jgi:hypothetical protein
MHDETAFPAQKRDKIRYTITLSYGTAAIYLAFSISYTIIHHQGYAKVTIHFGLRLTSSTARSSKALSMRML